MEPYTQKLDLSNLKGDNTMKLALFFAFIIASTNACVQQIPRAREHPPAAPVAPPGKDSLPPLPPAASNKVARNAPRQCAQIVQESVPRAANNEVTRNAPWQREKIVREVAPQRLTSLVPSPPSISELLRAQTTAIQNLSSELNSLEERIRKIEDKER